MSLQTFPKKAMRNHALNFLKGIGCIAVVLIHVKFPGTLGGILTNLAQFAVPVFFMISGYFAYSTSKDNYNLLKRRACKILKITLWSSFFFLVCKLLFVIKDRELDLWLSQVLTWQTWIGLFILNDFDLIKAGHLCFLPALLYAYVILYFIDKQRGYLFFYKLLPWLFLLLLSIGVYIGIHGYSYHWGANILSSLPFVLMGHYIAYSKDFRERWNNQTLMGFSALGALFACGSQFFEWMTYFSGFGVVVYSVSLFLLAINNSDISISEKVASLGDKYSLYVYIFHLAVAGVLSLLTKKIGWYDNIFYLWGRPIVVIVLTIIFSMCFHRLIHGNMYRKLRDHFC